jgi:hypothetical protein
MDVTQISEVLAKEYATAYTLLLLGVSLGCVAAKSVSLGRLKHHEAK